MDKQKRTENDADSLSRARNGGSVLNYAAIFDGFKEKGLPEDDIKPRENIFTFGAWRALGRMVRKGEHGVRVITWITGKGKDKKTGEEKGFRFPRRSTVFHISQTKPLAA